MEIHPIARFKSPFTSKFGIPKQSGLVEELEGLIVFEPEYRNPDALKGIEAFDFLWLIWGFSANKHSAASPMVRPPLLGGNVKMGVFATRSPFRPNPLGLSSVKLKGVEWESERGPILHVLGGDLMDGTPIFDIKPYITYADCHEDARSGFVDTHPIQRLKVEMPEELRRFFSENEQKILKKALELDPRPHYHQNPQKQYGMPFGHYDIHFSVTTDGVLRVTGVSGSNDDDAKFVKQPDGE
ncbi:MAG: tRNA (N6-threonylcarbamoyladenosine(37)-N6)-methyltransferase TrmO [Prevotella sp.]|jgi:tRNA-Thr(GGU) m(6)t(6)A37 methyltransferase TsaA